MRWIALPAGILVLVVTLLDVFSTLVMPRASRRRLRLTRLLFLVTWRPWRWVGVRMGTLERRERVLAVAAPMFFLVLLVSWAGLAVVGYALVLWSPAFVHGVHGHGAGGFGTALYFSGSSLFTIGFGDVVATGLTRAVVIVEGATGLGLVAVVIAYLPVLYQAFNRREVGILFLDARAGSPPSGPELLRRTGGEGLASDLPELFREWERWSADILETHLSYPLLAFFRSPHDYTSWVTTLGAVLDAATLVMASVEDGPYEQAKTFYLTGVHAVEDLWRYFSGEERPSMIERDEFHGVMEDLRTTGIALQDEDEAWEKFVRIRSRYGGRLDALAVLLASPPGQWIGDRSTLPVRRGMAASRH
jgi:ion channel